MNLLKPGEDPKAENSYIRPPINKVETPMRQLLASLPLL